MDYFKDKEKLVVHEKYLNILEILEKIYNGLPWLCKIFLHILLIQNPKRTFTYRFEEEKKYSKYVIF